MKIERVPIPKVMQQLEQLTGLPQVAIQREAASLIRGLRLNLKKISREEKYTASYRVRKKNRMRCSIKATYCATTTAVILNLQKLEMSSGMIDSSQSCLAILFTILSLEDFLLDITR